MLHLSKHPNPGARGNGQEQDTCDLSPEQFFEKNLLRLLRYCHSMWNGYGKDVLDEAVATGMKYEYMTFSLFHDLCLAAARDMKISRWQHDHEKTIILPPTRRPKEAMKCEKCGCEKFTDTLGFQKMCVQCGEKIDPPAPILDPGEDEDIATDDTEKIENVYENTIDSKVKAVIEAVMAGEKIVEAARQAGISYHNFRKKARQAWVQPSLFPVKNSTSDAYISMSGGAK